jgi:hypothetical protein
MAFQRNFKKVALVMANDLGLSPNKRLKYIIAVLEKVTLQPKERIKERREKGQQ